MKTYKNVFIGFGKGGKTLAKTLAKHGEEVLMIEESDQMYGGTCINIGCIPSKSLIVNGERNIPFPEAVAKRGDLTGRLRNKNFHMIADEETAEVWTGKARFTADHELSVTMEDGEVREIKGERIFINTGSTPNIPAIKGIANSKYVVTSKEIMELPELPKRLTIIGAGYIGLEFASMFASYGSQVTVIDNHETFIPREDPDIAKMVYQDLTEKGIRFELGANLLEVKDTENGVQVRYEKDGEQTVDGDILLVATGRKPNTAELGLENTNITVAANGAVTVDDYLRTTAENVWAIGDVKGGLQFTYISLDDYRIIEDQLFGNGKRKVSDRVNVPYTVFLTPPLSNVGLTEAQVKAQGYDYKVFQMMSAGVPKAQVLEDPKGMFKIIVDQKTQQILGASIYAEESHEVINLITLAMNAKLPYTMLRDQIYSHPTMTEALNDVLK
ncbi:FAD-dependent oxidoreductase [Enterococcus dongliensis]|uniref:FAD-dependent oxidoreductase n=1 Tax=Enterococcus dongliensis TaxID=2559925 RepID=UPI0028922073|nr:FAD-dependent oxidoreductase [Enterococcus dongliensis]MDT2613291.1 FAD-dependent oxidoreductase [Enterococcus dongliensis]